MTLQDLMWASYDAHPAFRPNDVDEPDLVDIFVAELAAECDRLASANGLASSARAAADAFGGERYLCSALSTATLGAIIDALGPTIAELRRRADGGATHRDELTVTGTEELSDVCGMLEGEFERLGIVARACDYSGQPLRATAAALELSVAAAPWWRTAPEGMAHPTRTAYVHIDASVRQLKAIVYLSNVGLSNGPVSLFPRVYEDLALNPVQDLVGRVLANVGSHVRSPLRTYYGRDAVPSEHAATFRAGIRADRARRHFMRLPKAARFNAHVGWDVLPGSAFETALVAREEVFSGRAGDFVVFDGARLFHRGGLVEQGTRLALQVVLSTGPSGLAHSIAERGSARQR